MNEDWQFGRCPVCDAIVSLDPNRNVLCDRCYQEENRQSVVGTSDLRIREA